MENEKTISILDVIDQWSHSYVLQQFENTPIEQPVRVLMFSYGGDVRSAYAIQALIIDECKKRIDKVRGFIGGIAASATTIVSTGIPIGKLGIAATANYMIHNVRVEIRNSEGITYFTAKDIRDVATVQKETSGAFETVAKKIGKSVPDIKQMLERFGIEHENETGLSYDQLFKLAEKMDKEDEMLISQLARRSNQTPEQIRAKYFDGEDHNLTAQEAVDEGFCDYVQDFEIKQPSLLEELTAAKNSESKEDYFRLVAQFDNNFFKTKNQTQKMADHVKEPNSLFKEIELSDNGSHANTDKTMLGQAKEVLLQKDTLINELKEKLAYFEGYSADLKVQLSKKEIDLTAQLEESNARAIIAETRLAKERSRFEIRASLIKAAYNIGVESTKFDSFVKTNLNTIEYQYESTIDGFFDKEDPNKKIVAKDIDGIVALRVEEIKAFFITQPATEQALSTPKFMGSGFSAGVSAKTSESFLANGKQLTADVRNQLYNLATKQGISIGSQEFIDLCKINGYTYNF